MSEGLDWPEAYDRTDPQDREPYPGSLSITRKEAFVSIVDELEKWEATEGSVRIETASQHYVDRPNIPHQHDKPDDVGVAAYFRREGERADREYAVACDRWESQRENARAVALWARRLRLAEKCEVTTAEDAVETAALPPGDKEAVAAPPAKSEPVLDEEPHEVLGVQPDADPKIVESVFRTQVKELNGHPDTGGSSDRFKRLQMAKEAMLDE